MYYILATQQNEVALIGEQRPRINLVILEGHEQIGTPKETVSGLKESEPMWIYKILYQFV